MQFIRLLSLLWLCGFSTFSHSENDAQTPGIWIDVRSEQEVSDYSVADTLNIPHPDIAQHIAAVTTDKNEAIHLFCGSGRRAEIARQSLLDLGYTNVSNEGGVIEAEKKLNAN